MRRAALIGMAAAALATGCGGSDGNGGRPQATAAAQGAGVAAVPQVSDGRLGAAVVARPGETKDRANGKVRRITGRSVLPPSTKHALGAEANCTDADLQPTAQNLQHVSDVVFCLMNAMRENEGVPNLRQQTDLAKASVDHSQDMVDKKYFAHDSLDGRDVVARLTQVGYVPKKGDWVVGENLAWGAGALATPKALVNAWMNSPAHRENLLSGDFQEVGMGVVLGTPSKDTNEGVTVTTDFGTRIGAGTSGTATGSSAAGDTDTALDPGTGSSSGQGAVAARKARSVRRKQAVRRCAKRHGAAKRRCVIAARRVR